MSPQPAGQRPVPEVPVAQHGEHRDTARRELLDEVVAIALLACAVLGPLEQQVGVERNHMVPGPQPIEIAAVPIPSRLFEASLEHSEETRGQVGLPLELEQVRSPS